jgi:hypothetical protein
MANKMVVSGTKRSTNDEPHNDPRKYPHRSPSFASHDALFLEFIRTGKSRSCKSTSFLKLFRGLKPNSSIKSPYHRLRGVHNSLDCLSRALLQKMERPGFWNRPLLMHLQLRCAMGALGSLNRYGRQAVGALLRRRSRGSSLLLPFKFIHPLDQEED